METTKMNDKRRQQIKEKVVEYYIDYFKLHNSCECKCCRWWKRRFDMLADLAISKTAGLLEKVHKKNLQEKTKAEGERILEIIFSCFETFGINEDGTEIEPLMKVDFATEKDYEISQHETRLMINFLAHIKKRLEAEEELKKKYCD